MNPPLASLSSHLWPHIVKHHITALIPHNKSAHLRPHIIENQLAVVLLKRLQALEATLLALALPAQHRALLRRQPLQQLAGHLEEPAPKGGRVSMFKHPQAFIEKGCRVLICRGK